MELSSAEKRREENIRKNREFQIQIGFTSLVEQNRVDFVLHGVFRFIII